MNTFFTKEEILQYVSVSTSLLMNQHKKAIDALKLFATNTQQTWLVSTSSNIICLLDQKEGSTEKFYQFDASFNSVLRELKAKKSSKTAGTINLGKSQGEWYYSTYLFPEPIDVEKAVKILIEKARTQSIGGNDRFRKKLLLTQTEVSVVLQALIQSDLDINNDRPVLLHSINNDIVSRLAINPQPRKQLIFDLYALNNTITQADGEFPLDIYLRNATILLIETDPAYEIVQQTLSLIRQRIAGLRG